jgi:hypothetical protein
MFLGLEDQRCGIERSEVKAAHSTMVSCLRSRVEEVPVMRVIRVIHSLRA